MLIRLRYLHSIRQTRWIRRNERLPQASLSHSAQWEVSSEASSFVEKMLQLTGLGKFFQSFPRHSSHRETQLESLKTFLSLIHPHALEVPQICVLTRLTASTQQSALRFTWSSLYVSQYSSTIDATRPQTGTAPTYRVFRASVTRFEESSCLASRFGPVPRNQGVVGANCVSGC